MFSTNGDALRREQLLEGQRMTRTEGTIHLKSAPRAKQQSVSRPSKPKLEGHEAMLKDLIKSGAKVNVELMSGESFSATVSHSDRFTITFRKMTKSLGSRDIVYFKHAIECFYPIDLRPKEQDQQKEETLH